MLLRCIKVYGGALEKRRSFDLAAEKNASSHMNGNHAPRVQIMVGTVLRKLRDFYSRVLKNAKRYLFEKRREMDGGGHK